MDRRRLAQVASDVDKDDGSQEEYEDDEEQKALKDGKPKPIGEVIRVSGDGGWRRNHYTEYEFDGLQFELGDYVLIAPEVVTDKPYIAIIQDIYVDHKGDMRIMVQWFYRPEDTEKHGCRNWQHTYDSRELFYSFHRDEISAACVMHKCVIHFVPLTKQIPRRSEHPGLVVQKVYCTERKRLFKLTDKDYNDYNKQEEFDLLMQKTMSRIGDLPDIEPDDGVVRGS